MDYAAEGFFDDLDDQAVVDRRELLDWLVSQGFGPEALRRGHRQGMLVFLAAEREVAGEPYLTAAQVAEQSGADPRLLAALRRANGLPLPEHDEPELSDLDVASARIARQFSELGLTDEQMIDTTRVLGRSLATAAEAMRTVALETALAPGSTEREVAERFAQAAHRVLPLVGPMVAHMVRLHLRDIVRSEALNADELASGTVAGARDTAVAFADLVGFTQLGEEIAPEDLGSVAEGLFSLAREIAVPPVRLVKTIGDAVMLTAPEPAPLLHTVLALVDAATADGGLPQVRVGVAYGPAAARGGDLFGRSVNLASRVTQIARAGTVLATGAVHDAVPDDVLWSAAGLRVLRGLPAPVTLYRARSLAESP